MICWIIFPIDNIYILLSIPLTWNTSLLYYYSLRSTRFAHIIIIIIIIIVVVIIILYKYFLRLWTWSY